MVNSLTTGKKYFDIVAGVFASNIPVPAKQILISRRNTLISLANLSDAFTRMLSEPKRFQRRTESIHRFVVLNYTLTSHIATLSYYLNSGGNNFRSMDLLPVIETSNQYFENAIYSLEKGESKIIEHDKKFLRKLNEEADILLEKRKKEISLGRLETETKKILVEVKSVIDQFNYIYNIVADIEKNCKENTS